MVAAVGAEHRRGVTLLGPQVCMRTRNQADERWTPTAEHGAPGPASRSATARVASSELLRVARLWASPQSSARRGPEMTMRRCGPQGRDDECQTGIVVVDAQSTLWQACASRRRRPSGTILAAVRVVVVAGIVARSARRQATGSSLPPQSSPQWSAVHPFPTSRHSRSTKPARSSHTSSTTNAVLRLARCSRGFMFGEIDGQSMLRAGGTMVLIRINPGLNERSEVPSPRL